MAKAKKATKKASAKKSPVKKAASTRVALVEKNGVKRPKETGATHVPWAVADKITEKQGRPATRAEVIAECTKKGCAHATITRQFQEWRVFNGVPSARAGAKPKKAPAKKAGKVKAAKPKAKPAAKKAAAKVRKPPKAKAVPAAPQTVTEVPAPPAG